MKWSTEDVFDGIDDHAGADSDQQHIAGDLHIPVIGRWRRQADVQIPRQIVIRDIASQRIAFAPLLGLPRRLATVMFLGQPGRTLTGTRLSAIVVADDAALVTTKADEQRGALPVVAGTATGICATISPAWFWGAGALLLLPLY